MRIGIDCRALQEPQPSGVSVYTRELVRALLVSPHAAQHTLVLFYNGWSLHNEATREALKQMVLPSDGSQLQANIEWRFITMPSKLFTAASMIRVIALSERAFAGCDVVWFPNLDFFPFETLAQPYAVTMHDASFIRLSHLLSVKERWRHWLLRPLSFLQGAAELITVSVYTSSDVQQLQLKDKSHVTPIYPGIDHAAGGVEPGVHSASTIDQRIEFPNGTSVQVGVGSPLIVSLATMEPRKNLPSLIEAFRSVRQRYPHAQLVLVGKAGHRSDELTQLAQQTDGVIVAEYLTEEQKWQLLRAATLCVYPSLYEGFGFPPLEAQSCGVPIVVGSHSSLPEVLGDSALHCDTTDSRSIRYAVEELLADTELRQRFIDRGYENITRFTWDRAAQRTLEVLDKAARAQYTDVV